MNKIESNVFLLTGGYDCVIKLWRVQNGTLIKNFSFEDQIVNCICIGSSKKFFYGGGAQAIRKFDKEASSYPILIYDNFAKNINCLKCNRNETWMVSAGEDGCIRIWDIRVNKSSQLKMNYGQTQFSCTINPNETLIYSCGKDGNVNIWDIRHNSHKSIITEPNVQANSITLDIIGRFLAVINNSGKCFIQDISTIKDPFNSSFSSFQKCFSPHTKFGLSCIFSTDQQYLATCSADKSVKIWKLPEYDLVHVLENPKQRWVWDCDFSLDSKFIITCSSDISGRLWHVGKSIIVKEYFGHKTFLTSMALSDCSST